MLEFNKQDIIELNKSLNDDLSGWRYKEHLLNSCFSSYYYESEPEQICSIFRGIAKNHAFSNANKRTASIVLVALLEQINYTISDNDLINITLDVAEHNYEVLEITEKISRLIQPIN